MNGLAPTLKIACIVVCLLTTAAWFFGCEYYRGRPEASRRRVFILRLVGPLGTIALAIVSIIFTSQMRN